MGRKVTVRVTRKLLDWAIQQTSTQCAVALGLKDADEDIIRPKVTQDAIAFTDYRTDARYTFDVPEHIAKKIDAFDRDPSSVKPFTFTLDLDEAREIRPSVHKRHSVEAQVRDYEKRQRKEIETRPAESQKIYRPLRTDYRVPGV